MKTRTTLPIIVSALLAVLPGVYLHAQQPAAPASEAQLANKPATVAAASSAPAAATRTRDTSGYDTLSVDFPDEDIRNILRNVADLFELNLAMPDSLQGKTTIKLRDVT